MKEIFANARRPYPLFQGGDGITTNNLLHKLHTNQHDVLAVGKIDNPDFRQTAGEVSNQLIQLNVEMGKVTNERIEYKNPNSYSCVLLKDEHFEPELKKTLEVNRPDIVLTQLNQSHKVVEIAHDLKIKTVLFVHDHHPFNYLATNISEKVSHVFFNSRSTQEHFGHLLRCPSSVLYCPLEPDLYKCDKVDPRYVTMVNPIPDKGSAIVEQLIQTFPDQRFLLVSGWREISDNFRNYENVELMERQQDMREVYYKTKILLVPSQWEEAFGRVVIEAMVNRIPVIASRVGGLPESVGEGGILVDDFVSPSAWIDSMNRLLNDQSLNKDLSEKGYQHALTFDANLIYAQFIEVLNRVNGM